MGHFLTLHSSMNSLRNEQMDVKISLDERFNVVEKELKNIRHYVKRNEPFHAMVRNSNSCNSNPVKTECSEDSEVSDYNLPPATISSTPKTLHDLWDEYQVGIGGRKAAKDFTFHERGKVKSLYSKHKLIWDCISGLIKHGHTSYVTISKIYAAYGGISSNTLIMKKIKMIRKMVGILT